VVAEKAELGIIIVIEAGSPGTEDTCKIESAYSNPKTKKKKYKKNPAHTRCKASTPLKTYLRV
jgi:hypothetical protein